MLALYVGEKKEGRKTKGKEAKRMSAESDSESSNGDSDFEDDPDPMAPDAAEFNQAKDGDASFNFDAPEYRHAFDAIPTEHSPEMLSLYLVYKIYGQGRKIGTADTIHAAFKYMWKMSDGDKYRNKWHFNTASGAWEGNPAETAKVQDTMAAIKNKCGKDGGDRKHSLAMTEEFMTRMFEWSDNVCPPSNYDKTSTTREEENLKTKHLAFKCFSSTSWTIWSRCFELIKLQRKHLTFGLEDSKAFNTPYFELKLTYLKEDVYGHPLQLDDYIFPATGANGIVQTGEHISHEDVQKWITEFATGADLPRANGTFSTHCFPPRRCTRDTLIKYLLDELNTYEDDYSGMLLLSQPDTDRTFLGEGSSIAPATVENITQLHQSLSTDIHSLSGAFDRLLSIVASTITGSASQPSLSIGSDRENIPGPQSSLTIQCPRGPPAFHLTRPLIPISLSTPAIIAASNSVSVSTRRLPDKGLIVPDVPVTLPSGMRYNRNEEDFLKAYPEAEDGSSRLLAAINEARKKRGDLIPRK
ncbi:hypothetical protein B0H14DRAFT_3175834 [Mycena olivaceomarginata]|nr:hypothetical protein B0H14DRAFT_3175834 [Mycena olivaceomarginata]